MTVFVIILAACSLMTASNLASGEGRHLAVHRALDDAQTPASRSRQHPATLPHVGPSTSGGGSRGPLSGTAHSGRGDAPEEPAAAAGSRDGTPLTHGKAGRPFISRHDSHNPEQHSRTPGPGADTESLEPAVSLDGDPSVSSSFLDALSAFVSLLSRLPPQYSSLVTSIANEILRSLSSIAQLLTNSSGRSQYVGSANYNSLRSAPGSYEQLPPSEPVSFSYDLLPLGAYDLPAGDESVSEYHSVYEGMNKNFKILAAIKKLIKDIKAIIIHKVKVKKWEKIDFIKAYGASKLKKIANFFKTIKLALKKIPVFLWKLLVAKVYFTKSKLFSVTDLFKKPKPLSGFFVPNVLASYKFRPGNVASSHYTHAGFPKFVRHINSPASVIKPISQLLWPTKYRQMPATYAPLPGTYDLPYGPPADTQEPRLEPCLLSTDGSASPLQSHGPSWSYGLPAEGSVSPIQSYGLPAEGTASPIQSYGLPAEGTVSPIQSYGLPAEGTVSPIQSYGLPAEGTVSPIQSYGLPAEGTVSPIQSYGLPTEGSVSPIQSFGLPAEGSVSPIQSYGLPAEGSVSPIQSYGLPAEGSVSPIQSYGLPAEGTVSPIQSYGLPAEGSVSPIQSYGLPAEASASLDQFHGPPSESLELQREQGMPVQQSHVPLTEFHPSSPGNTSPTMYQLASAHQVTAVDSYGRPTAPYEGPSPHGLSSPLSGHVLRTAESLWTGSQFARKQRYTDIQDEDHEYGTHTSPAAKDHTGLHNQTSSEADSGNEVKEASADEDPSRTPRPTILLRDNTSA